MNIFMHQVNSNVCLLLYVGRELACPSTAFQVFKNQTLVYKVCGHHQLTRVSWQPELHIFYLHRAWLPHKDGS